MPYEAAHCGTPALLQDAQGFRDQIDDAGDRGALLRFEKDPKEERAAKEQPRVREGFRILHRAEWRRAEAMDRTGAAASAIPSG